MQLKYLKLKISLLISYISKSYSVNQKYTYKTVRFLNSEKAISLRIILILIVWQTE